MLESARKYRGFERNVITRPRGNARNPRSNDRNANEMFSGCLPIVRCPFSGVRKVRVMCAKMREKPGVLRDRSRGTARNPRSTARNVRVSFPGVFFGIAEKPRTTDHGLRTNNLQPVTSNLQLYWTLDFGLWTLV